MVNVAKGLSLVVGGLVIFLIFMLFVPLYLGFYTGVSTDNFTAAGQTAWAAIPDFIAIGGMLLGLGIFLIGVLDMVGINIVKRAGFS
jgi:hypothetical protein